ncbi:MAG TPA: hypothetical protein VM820_08885 [Vicinamibacterales bacterium]|jgi:hypothetical protein|nr:hypothetical protein [Vicinamibacterales bacterium]
MSFLKRLLGKAEEPKTRVRVCVECGMPIAEHKAWCSILKGQLEMQRGAEAATSRAD